MADLRIIADLRGKFRTFVPLPGIHRKFGPSPSRTVVLTHAARDAVVHRRSRPAKVTPQPEKNLSNRMARALPTIPRSQVTDLKKDQKQVP